MSDIGIDSPIGKRVRLKKGRAATFIQPWRRRFEQGREGTVIGGPSANVLGWMVEWDHRKGSRSVDWRLVHSINDLVILPQDKCPHEARGGYHEEYTRPDGSSFCRSCGAELTPPKAR